MRYARASSFAASFLLAAVAVAATYTVTTTADSGAGSLRQAILDSNASVGVTYTIEFNITGAGCTGTPTVCTIKPTSELPALTDPVVIDGYTQPGSSVNTLSIGDNAVLLCEIDGSLAGSAQGILVQTDSIVIQGLVINRFNPTAIFIDAAGGLGAAGGHIIRGNFIGTDPTGTSAAVPVASTPMRLPWMTSSSRPRTSPAAAAAATAALREPALEARWPSSS